MMHPLLRWRICGTRLNTTQSTEIVGLHHCPEFGQGKFYRRERLGAEGENATSVPTTSLTSNTARLGASAGGISDSTIPVKLALMMPCPISVYVQGRKTQISTMLPTSIVEFFPKAGIKKIAVEMEKGILGIIEEAK